MSFSSLKAKVQGRVLTRTYKAFPEIETKIFLVGNKELAWVRPILSSKFSLVCLLPTETLSAGQLYGKIVDSYEEGSIKDAISKWFSDCGVEVDWN